MILGFGILSIAYFWPEILKIKVIAKKCEFCLFFWQLSDTNGESLPYDKKMSNPLLITQFHNFIVTHLNLEQQGWLLFSNKNEVDNFDPHFDCTDVFQLRWVLKQLLE